MPTKKSTRGEWKARVLAWQRSGAGPTAFAKRAGVSARSLAWWRWRLARDGELPERGSERMAFVNVAPEPAAVTASIAIELGNGRVVRVAPGFDEAVLGRVLAIADGSAS